MQPSCTETLETVLPALLRRNPGALAQGTVVQFIVPDVGPCRYFYTWSGDDVVVQQGVSDRVDLTLSLVSEDLEKFLSQTLDFEHALRTRRVKVMGDPEILVGLAEGLAGRPS